MFHRSLVSLSLLTLLPSSVSFGQAPQFQDGDRVTFIGDSITHTGTYHSHVYLFYLTRFPDREIRIANAGISGDSAYGAIRRFDVDIAPSNPTVSTIMLGMNDVGRSLYGVDKTDAESIAKQQEQLELYRIRMGRLIDKVETLDTDIILITPSIYDQTAELEKVNQLGVNDALSDCATFIKETAEQKGFGLIDFHAPMTELNAAQQVDDPSFSIVGKDRVHPNGSFGHFVMAYLFLKDQAVPQQVSYLEIDHRAGSLLRVENAELSDLQHTSDSLSFKLLEAALPFPQTPNLTPALELVPFEAEMNQQVLKVQNLEAGSYALAIDDQPQGEWTAEALATGINLATLETTPQYQQALVLKELNERRYQLNEALRKVAFTDISLGFTKDAVDMTDSQQVQARIDAKLQDLEGKSYKPYFEKQFAAFLELYPQLDTIHAELEAIHTEMYQVNQPVERHYVIQQR